MENYYQNLLNKKKDILDKIKENNYSILYKSKNCCDYYNKGWKVCYIISYNEDDNNLNVIDFINNSKENIVINAKNKNLISYFRKYSKPDFIRRNIQRNEVNVLKERLNLLKSFNFDDFDNNNENNENEKSNNIEAKTNIQSQEQTNKENIFTPEKNRVIITDVNLKKKFQSNKSQLEKLKKIQEEINQKKKLIFDIDNKINSMSTIQNRNYFFLPKKSSFSQKNSIELINLKNKSLSLETSIQKLNNKQIKLENESYENLSDSNKSMILHKIQLNKIKTEKNLMLSKLNEINIQINNILNNEKNLNKSSIIKNYIENFENDRERYSNKMLNLSIKTKKHREEFIKKLNSDLNNINNEYIENKKKEELNKKIKLQNFKENLKTIENNRKEKINERNKYKKFINNVPKKKDKNYITFEEREEMFKKKEEEILNVNLAKRKEYFKHISKNELDEFENKIKLNEKKIKLELEEKKNKLNKIFQERKKLIPNYHSKFFEFNVNLEKENKEKFLVKKNEEIQRAKNRIVFDKEVKKNFFPNVNEKLKKEIEDRKKILAKEEQIHEIKNLTNKIKNKSNKIISVPKVKITEMSKLKINEKEKEILSERKKNNEEREKIDYLKDLKNSKELLKKVDNNLKWKKILDNKTNNRNIFDNINDVKVQADKMQNEAKFKQQLYNMENNAEKYPQLSEEIGNLYINSIEAKLQILNRINENNGILENNDEN